MKIAMSRLFQVDLKSEILFKHKVSINSLTVAVPYTGRLTLLEYITIKS